MMISNSITLSLLLSSSLFFFFFLNLCNSQTTTTTRSTPTRHTKTTSTSSSINVWPKPRTLKWAHPHRTTFLSPNFTISSSSSATKHHPYLSSAFLRYLHLITTEHHRPILHPIATTSPLPPLDNLTITVNNLAAPLHHGTNESYTLTIAENRATLFSDTAWGAMRGLETFSQLVLGNPPHVPVGLHVWDEPLFAHRGLLLDTSRNFYGVEDILRTIEALSANKLNVFHWHITDSHSFPLVLPSEPGLSGNGSYGEGMQYSPDDVAKIVRFGFEHGVRVLPEIDSPGSFY